MLRHYIRIHIAIFVSRVFSFHCLCCLQDWKRETIRHYFISVPIKALAPLHNPSKMQRGTDPKRSGALAGSSRQEKHPANHPPGATTSVKPTAAVATPGASHRLPSGAHHHEAATNTVTSPAGYAIVSSGTAPATSNSRGTTQGAKSTATISSADTGGHGGANKKRNKPSGGQGAGSASKRRAPGILKTAQMWATSQAPDLEAFQTKSARTGHIEPLPPLPEPTRRQAAAEHDLKKAAERNQQQGRSNRSSNATTRNSSPNKHNRTRDHHFDRHGGTPVYPSPSSSTAAGSGGRSAPGGHPHPVAVAFASGSDAQLAHLIDGELVRRNQAAQADPARYATAVMGAGWAAVAGAGGADGQYSAVEGVNQHQMPHFHHLLHGGDYAALPSTLIGQDGRQQLPGPPSSHASYFMQPPAGKQTYGHHHQYDDQKHQQYYHYAAGAGQTAAAGRDRYPRRSSRGRNAKRDDLYLTLDSQEEEDTDDDAMVDASAGAAAAAAATGGGNPNDPRRGPGRPRKQPQQQPDLPPPPSSRDARLHLQIPLVPQPNRHRGTPSSTPPAFLLPPAGDILSPFAQFLFDQSGEEPAAAADGGGGGGGGGVGAPAAAAAAAVSAVGDVVDYVALDEFIAGLNFSNDVVLGSPAAMAMLTMAGGGSTGGGGLKHFSPPGMRFPGLPELPAGAGGAGGGAFTDKARSWQQQQQQQHQHSHLVPSLVPDTATATQTGVEGQPSVQKTDGVVRLTVVSGTAAAAAASPPDGAKNKAELTEESPPTLGIISSHNSGSVVAPAPVAPPVLGDIVDLAICKPLETPTVAGLLSMGPLGRKSPTPGLSPNPILSPSLLDYF